MYSKKMKEGGAMSGLLCLQQPGLTPLFIHTIRLMMFLS